jgi:hypothetical protein
LPTAAAAPKTPAVPVRIDGVADPALDLNPDDKCCQEILSGNLSLFCKRQQGRGDWAGRVDDRFQMRVIIVKDMARDPVDQGRM